MGSPAPRWITAGPDGAIWFTDAGTHSVGRLDPATGAITECPLPEVREGARGYPTMSESSPPQKTYISINAPGAITTVRSELWVASATGEGMVSANPAATAARVATRHRRHRR
jgi:hypothetical protein